MAYPALTAVFLTGILMTGAFHRTPASESPGAAAQDENGVVLAGYRQVDSTETTLSILLHLVTGEGDTIRAMMRRPRDTAARSPVAFLLVGIETGKEVVDLIQGHDDLVIFGMDYPFEGVFELSGWSGFTTAIELRSMAFRTVENTHAALDYLTSLPYVDTSDITMIAVSFGIFTGVPAAVSDDRVKRLAVVQAGGDLAEVIGGNAERLGIQLPAWLAGKLGEMILGPFEPNDHIADFAPRPLILVTGEGDPFFPMSSLESFYEAAREPKEWLRHSSPHVMPDARELIIELTRILAGKLYGNSGGG